MATILLNLLFFVLVAISTATAEHQDDGRYLAEASVGSECGTSRRSSREISRDNQNMREYVNKNREVQYDLAILEQQRTTKSYNIPVYFHIIQEDASSGGITYESVDEYMLYLNQFFANNSAPFTFKLEKTSRTINADWSANCMDRNYQLEYKSLLKVDDGAETLNIYHCTDAQYNGFSYYPYEGIENDVLDGVIIRFGYEERLNTLVHEVGHWLGLYHTYEGESCSSRNDNDFVDDTPQHIIPRNSFDRFNCLSPPEAQIDTCPDQPGEDPVNNIMTNTLVFGVTDNIACRTEFTPGQIERMVAQFEMYRMGKLADSQYKCSKLFRSCKTSGLCCSGLCLPWIERCSPSFLNFL